MAIFVSLHTQNATCTVNTPLVILFINQGSDGHFCSFRVFHEVSIKVCHRGDTNEFKTSHILKPHLGEGPKEPAPSIKTTMSLSPHLGMSF